MLKLDINMYVECDPDPILFDTFNHDLIGFNVTTAYIILYSALGAATGVTIGIGCAWLSWNWYCTIVGSIIYQNTFHISCI